MKKKKKHILLLIMLPVFLITVLVLPPPLRSGPLDPPSSAVDENGNPVSTMHTLEEIFHGSYLYCPWSAHIRFEDNLDGSVTDCVSGLTWLKDANCFGELSYDNADNACTGLQEGECGLQDSSQAGDWRIPSRDDFASLADSSYSDPPISNADGTGQWTECDAFCNLQYLTNWDGNRYHYWTSDWQSEIWGTKYLALFGSTVSFNGYDHVSYLYDVWCVR